MIIGKVHSSISFLPLNEIVGEWDEVGRLCSKVIWKIRRQLQRYDFRERCIYANSIRNPKTDARKQPIYFSYLKSKGRDGFGKHIVASRSQRMQNLSNEEL